MTDIVSTLESNIIAEAQPARIAAAAVEFAPVLLLAAIVAAVLAAITSVMPSAFTQLSLLTMN